MNRHVSPLARRIIVAFLVGVTMGVINAIVRVMMGQDGVLNDAVRVTIISVGAAWIAIGWWNVK